MIEVCYSSGVCHKSRADPFCASIRLPCLSSDEDRKNLPAVEPDPAALRAVVDFDSLPVCQIQLDVTNGTLILFLQLLQKHRRAGHLFQGRFKAILIEKESYLLEVCRYVVLNPVRAKAVKLPEEWAWSSYRGTAGIQKPHPCLTTVWLLGQMRSRRSDASKHYRHFVREGIREESIWSKLENQILLGEEAFIRKLAPYIRKQEEIKEIPRLQRRFGRPSLEHLLGGEAERNQREKIVEAVQVHGYSQREVADYFGMHYSTISRLMREKKTKKSIFKTRPL